MTKKEKKLKKKINAQKENTYKSFISIFVCAITILSSFSQFIFEKNTLDVISIIMVLISIPIYYFLNRILAKRIELQKGKTNNDKLICGVEKIANITDWLAYPLLALEVIVGIYLN